ncbi:hypothetical protein CYMTET_19813 [Cymbomonas tetramitiformis]|uniref:Ankyrin repeat domain-containing protein n=1 Tax=Cymbomonas tetramitiformis TaxID=36881 RepID=A0AAE0L4I1_9CHLO|nr:hypothetical protein CYMTET_19813 [Cymbomonas tetramitiformis]
MVEMVRELVEKGAEVDAEDREGRSALTVALAFGQEAAAQALLEAGAGVNAGSRQRPLHAAAEMSTVEMVAAARALLEAGAGVNAGTGRRPLHAAAERGLVEMAGDVLYFMLRGAVLEVALNDSPFEVAFAELPGGVVPFVQLSDDAQKVELNGVRQARQRAGDEVFGMRRTEILRLVQE